MKNKRTPNKLFVATALIVLSTILVFVQKILKIRPECRGLSCAFSEMGANLIIFILWLIGLISLITWKKSRKTELKATERAILILDIMMLVFCVIFPCMFFVNMFLPPEAQIKFFLQ